MGQKTISLTEAVYRKLVKRKPKNQSYSEFLDELLEEKKPKRIDEISQFNGCLEDGIINEWDSILEGLYEDRKKVSNRNVNLDE